MLILAPLVPATVAAPAPATGPVSIPVNIGIGMDLQSILMFVVCIKANQNKIIVLAKATYLWLLNAPRPSVITFLPIVLALSAKAASK